MAKILIVDDEEIIRALVSKVLTIGGYENVLNAMSGEEGLELFQRETPDLVICDVAMPGIGGLETIRRMREMNPGSKIMALTGSGNRSLVLSKEAGADLAFPKPFMIGDFLQWVKLLLGEET